jgi:Predicted pyridoxal phosphate-dependent enzyme apparently involved in regulation of cell wall biogenesis
MARARYLATQAREPARHYEHREVGYNYRMSNLLAGLGLSQLSDLPRRIAARRVHYEAYQAAFADSGTVEMMPLVDPGAANYWLSCLTFRDPGGQALRDRVIACLEAADIEARPLWKPMHLQPVFKDCPCFGGAVSADLFARGLCLPSGSALSPSEREQVIAAVLEQLP